jgi:hypothetical protein
MRLSTGSGILRGDLRLEPRGRALLGSLVLESSDGPPVAIRDGRTDPSGEVTFSVDAGEPMRFNGRRDGAGLAGQVALARGRVWQWSAERLAEGAEFYAALPRFRAAQLTVGSNLTEFRLPGAWVAVADSEPGIAPRAAQLAATAGLPPIPADSVRAYGFLPAMGLLQRNEMIAAMVRALTTIRADLPPASRPPFDALFRPRGAWLVDLHDAALDAARRANRSAAWEDARPALAAAGLLPSDLPPGTAVLPLALYRLAVLRERDTMAYQAARERLPLGGQSSARTAELLLDGYRDAALWQAQALSFLLTADWVTDAGVRTSPAALVGAAWGRADLTMPAIRPRYFGYPEAVPRVGTPGSAIARIVVPENWAAEQWALRRGPGGVLNVLRALDVGVGLNTTLEADGPWRLTSVAREAAAAPAGFLEPADEIIEDPGTPPLYAVATAIHEWQHLLMEGYRLSLSEGGALRADGSGLRIASSDIFLAEGFAGWMTERVLAPVLARSPIIGVGDARKLVVLEADNRSDPHVLGLRMMRALVSAMGSPATAGALVLAHGDAPSDVAAAVPAWSGRDTPDRVLPGRGQRRLVPETRFTVEDGVGDVLGTWIRTRP